MGGGGGGAASAQFICTKLMDEQRKKASDTVPMPFFIFSENLFSMIMTPL
ncbi:MAG TPA: hypothetical protein K8V65_08620 [Megamonas hypermegale]|uniref:Uncharacterized protein n=1 Tax=Megamonas hypermegale TaxID=158847 RepID=A0A921L8F7_9FIRM|nr:hypothetical protein [Megamonas hypermegale]